MHLPADGQCTHALPCHAMPVNFTKSDNQRFSTQIEKKSSKIDFSIDFI
jgi:hypothetical protein